MTLLMLITETGWTPWCDDFRVHLLTLVHLLSPCNFVATHELSKWKSLICAQLPVCTLLTRHLLSRKHTLKLIFIKYP